MEKNVAFRDLQVLFEVGAVGRLPDGQLLGRFLAQREETVFEAIVDRHGPMVWDVCRRVLRDLHDAEDAFQATFLIFARKANSVWPREKLGPWLHGVAYQTARKARATRAKRRMREGPTQDLAEPEAVREEPRDDVLPLLDQEISRLPEKYRIPIVLCELEGKTHREAAEQLGWPIGTVSGGLSRARALLAKRLSRRGVTLGVGSLALLGAEHAASAGVPPTLVSSTIRAATRFAAGGTAVSAEVLSLTKGVLKMMLLSRIKIIPVALLMGLTFAGAGTGLAYVTQATPAGTGGSTTGRQEPPDGKPPTTDPVKKGVGSTLPGSGQNAFGGGPDEPSYQRQGNTFYVISPIGDRFSIYDAATKKVSVLRLPGTKESPLKVNFILGENILSLILEGSKISRIYVFCPDSWQWYSQDLREPVTGSISPIVSQSAAVYAQGRYRYAFSADTKRWGVLELPEDAPENPRMLVMADSVVIEYGSQVYEFRYKTGEWQHTDLRAVIDAAIESAEKEAK